MKKITGFLLAFILVLNLVICNGINVYAEELEEQTEDTSLVEGDSNTITITLGKGVVAYRDDMTEEEMRNFAETGEGGVKDKLVVDKNEVYKWNVCCMFAEVPDGKYIKGLRFNPSYIYDDFGMGSCGLGGVQGDCTITIDIGDKVPTTVDLRSGSKTYPYLDEEGIGIANAMTSYPTEDGINEIYFNDGDYIPDLIMNNYANFETGQVIDAVVFTKHPDSKFKGSYVYESDRFQKYGPITFIFDDTVKESLVAKGIYCQSNYPSIQAGIVVEKANDQDEVEYRWVACNNNDPEKWFEISPWTTSTNWMNWTPEENGGYVFVCYARVVGHEETEVQYAFGTEYHKKISGICQMPYTGEGGGYLIGIESRDNPNQSLEYEMLILDCTLLQQGKEPWVYTTGRCGVASGNALWTVWQPQYGYYWTLFRIYDKNGNMLDEACYGFANVF